MSKWTDERVNLLTKLWCEGKTAKEIAGVLGDGVTRNAVIGKAHRLKLSGRVSPIQHNKSPKQTLVEETAKKSGKLLATKVTAQQIAKRKATQQTSDDKPVRISRHEMSEVAEKTFGPGVALIDLKDSMCKWPIGDPQDSENFHFCGAKKGGLSHYCPPHAQVAYNANVRTKKIPDVDESAGATRREEADEMLANVANA